MASIIQSRWLGIVTFVVIAAIWEAVCSFGWVNRVLLPPPSAILVVLEEIITSGSFAAPLGQTLLLLFAGYSIACVVGITLGLAMGTNERIYNLFEPLIELVRPIPKPALVPPLFLFLGLGATMKISVVALAATFPVLISTIQGVRGVDPVALDTARTFRCSRMRTIFQIILPASMPDILTGMRVSLGLGLVLVVLAEMLAGQGGLGFLILDMQRSFEIREMYAWILILALIGLGLNALFEFVEVRAVPWRSK
ncbi:ABC transporter permease [Microbacteriaceae bacterium K1510]|nr:ABC transporter permease [Microbacteriaceae bacterium K1510]